MMDRLPFALPNFCRVSWASQASQSRWGAVLGEMGRLWKRLEEATVVAGMRRGALIPLPAAEMGLCETRLGARGLTVLPLCSLDNEGGYVGELGASTATSKERFCAVGDPSTVAEMQEAFSNHRTDALGAILGYPSCCVQFFEEVWNTQGFIDTTWAMATRTASVTIANEAVFDAAILPETNMLLRWLGVRPVFHLPCSFDCQASVEVARAIKRVAIATGDEAGIQTLYEMLSWPTQWSALHGIAEIETPALRLATRTDATARKYTVRNRGHAAAVEGAPRGTRFPFLPNGRPSTTRSVPKVLREPASRASLPDTKCHEDNGFRSNFEMERAFEPVLGALEALSPRSLLHLACRNGAMLKLAHMRDPQLCVFGIASDPGHIERARMFFPEQAANFVLGSFSEDEMLSTLPRVDVVVLMLGRLLEISPDRADAVLEALRLGGATLVVYAFDDWLKRRSLSEMAQGLGLQLRFAEGDISQSVAAVVRAASADNLLAVQTAVDGAHRLAG